ncbi:MAG TPA: hypothetical protein VKE51_28910 [Vicinamibacterales bacterium]|nr:hypothetical protein [Vicinamibacterales bacterium]
MVSVQQPLPRLRDRAAESAALPRSRADHRALAIAAGLAGLLGALLVAAPAPAPLSTSQQKILVDGQPTFLTGVSLFDALGSAPPRDADLDALGPWGVNTVRVWAHWHTPVYQSDGALTADGRLRLLALAGRLQSRSLILELVVLRPGQLPGQPFAVFASEAARLKAVEAITEALRPFRNVLFDLYNEHDHPDGPISHAAARALRDRVKAIDPSRLVTISSTESHVISAAGTIDENGDRNLRDEAGSGPGAVAVDIVAPHFPRTDSWASATADRIKAVRAALEGIGSHAPIYLNEERRADRGVRIAPRTYSSARAAAATAGAAGWVFHTSAGFELGKSAFLDALSPDERAGLQRLRR